MRFAIVATPRSGNSVLRKVIAAAYGLQEFGGHDADLLRAELPDNSIVQVHARYSAELHQVMLDHDVIIVTPTRHPLDTLLSMLHFKQFEPEVNSWLGGNYLADLGGCDPTSKAFRAFATGEGAHELLGVSLGWWDHAKVTARYRDFAHDPSLILEYPGMPAPLLSRHHPSVRDSSSFARFHSAPNMHGWLGRPDYWREFIPTSFAEVLYDIHRANFELGTFDITGSEELTPQQVRTNWAAAFTGREESEHLTLSQRIALRSQRATTAVTGAAAGAAGTAGIFQIFG